MTKSLIAGIVWPAVATGVILALGAILRRHRRGTLPPIADRARKHTWLDGAVAAIAISIGYCVGHIAILGRPSFPPASAEHWLIPVALVAGLLAVLECAYRLPSAARWIVRVAALGAFLVIPLGPMWRYFTETREWSRSTTAAWMAAFAAVFLAGWVSSEVSVRRLAGWSATVPIGVAIAGLAIVSAISGSASLGQLAGALAVSLGTLTLADAVSGGGRPIGGAVSVCWFLMIAVLFNAFTFGEVTPVPASLLVGASFGSLVAVPTAGRRSRRWIGGVTAAGVSLLMTAFAVFLAYREYASLEELPY